MKDEKAIKHILSILEESVNKQNLKEAREVHDDTIGAMSSLRDILDRNIQQSQNGINMDEIKNAVKLLNAQLGTEKQIQSVHSKYEKEISKITASKEKDSKRPTNPASIKSAVEEAPNDNVSPLKKSEGNKQATPAINKGKVPIAPGTTKTGPYSHVAEDDKEREIARRQKESDEDENEDY